MAENKKSGGKKAKARKAATKTKKTQKGISIDRGEIARWIIGFLAVFVMLTFIPAISTGWLGSAVSGFLKGIFGPMYYAFPVIILIVLFRWRKDHEARVAFVKYVLYTLLFLFLSMVVHIIVSVDGAEYTVKTLYESGKLLESGGIISGGISVVFVSMMGPVASMVLGILGVFVCTVLALGSSPKATIGAIADFFKEKAAESRYEDGDEDEDEPVTEKAPSRKKTVPALPAELPDDPADDGIEDNGETAPWEEPPVPVTAEKPDAQEFAEEADIPEAEFEREEEEELYLEPIEDTPYVFPPISLLTEDDSSGIKPSKAEIDRTSRKLEEVLASFNVKAHVISTSYGPTVTRYELQPETGVRVRSIANLADDIALHLAAASVRIENIPGKVAIGIEIPNRSVATVRLRSLIENASFKEGKSRLLTALGEDAAGNPIFLDVAKMPHLLIAGATGMGKSVCMNSLIISLLYRAHPDEVKLILIDPKRVELTDYNGIPHLLVPVINEPKKAAGTLNWLCNEMERRYTLIQEVGARDLMGYNLSVVDDPERETMPQIVIIIDELADLMMTAPGDVESSICRLAQKARAAGMHLVIGTQRPSVDVITGLIKANIPSRIAFTVQSQVDSRTILDMAGAEKLLGRGDMLYYPVGAMKPIRVQGAFVDGKSEVSSVTQFIKEAATAKYDESIMQQIEQEAKLCGIKGRKGSAAAEAAEADSGDDKDDPVLIDAIGVAIETGTISTSLLQRKLSLGYARAARIVDKMQSKGYIGDFDPTTKRRAILITKEEYLEMKLNAAKQTEENSSDE